MIVTVPLALRQVAAVQVEPVLKAALGMLVTTVGMAQLQETNL